MFIDCKYKGNESLLAQKWVCCTLLRERNFVCWQMWRSRVSCVEAEGRSRELIRHAWTFRKAVVKSMQWGRSQLIPSCWRNRSQTLGGHVWRVARRKQAGVFAVSSWVRLDGSPDSLSWLLLAQFNYYVCIINRAPAHVP